jgi:GPH family glycoside/pentoside/hexuronide:cation symporter
MVLTVPLAIFFALVWLPPAFVAHNQTLLFWYFIFALCIFDGLHTTVGLNLLAVFPQMYPGLKERAEVSSYRQVFAIVGSIIGIASPPLVYAAFGWGAMGVLFGAIALVSIFAARFGMRESAIASEEKEMPLRDALIATFKNRSFITFMGLMIFLQFAFLLITAVVPFFAKYVLHEQETVTALLLFATFAVAFPMVFVWGNLMTRFGSRKAVIAALTLFAVMLVPLFFANTVTETIIITGAIGIPLAGLFVLPDVMLADVIDEDEQKTGRRREGMYFGMQGLLIRGGIILQALALNVTLTATGYNADLAVAAQSPALELGLRVLISAIPIGALVLAVLCALAYPLNATRLAEIHRARFARDT